MSIQEHTAGEDCKRVIVVTDSDGLPKRITAPSFGVQEGHLVLGEITDSPRGPVLVSPVAAWAPGHWKRACEEGAEVRADDAQAKALIIAREALRRVYGYAHGENDAEDLAAVIGIADKALGELADLGYE